VHVADHHAEHDGGMKYPGLPAAGADPDGSGWALAGSDLRAATRLLEDPAGPAARVQYAEVLRRRFETGAALRVLSSGDSAERTVDELLCLGRRSGSPPRCDAATPERRVRPLRSRGSTPPRSSVRTRWTTWTPTRVDTPG
jgi:hypothetical protein